MIVMTPEATEPEIAAVRGRLEATGVHVLVLPGELIDRDRRDRRPRGRARAGPGGHGRRRPRRADLAALQARLVRARPPRADRLRRRRAHDRRRRETFALIAGPCTVESREQTLTVARTVAAAGACMLRGGAFKPRTSPFAFKGLGAPGLEILAEARAETGLPVVTELLDAAHVELVAALRRRDPDRRAQHAELRAARGRRASSASRCCSSAGSPPRSTSC